MLHTVFSAECNPIFDWHSIALFHSHRTSGQQGGITRLLACSREQLKTYRGLDIGPTFVHHNHRADEHMNYAAFNKPASVNYWVHSGAVPPGVEYVMQLDADMIIHRPVDPINLGAAPGTVVSAPYDYLIGTNTGLPDVFGVKNKHLMARVGGVHIFHVEDLRKTAPHWLNYTERVRDFACREPERYYALAAPEGNRIDDTEVTKGRRRQFMWMVEMYGYVFGAAEAGIAKHVVSRELMRYTGDVLQGPGPYIIHYGIDWQVQWKDHDGIERSYDFNKLIYLAFDPASCPRWFFPLPPFSTPDASGGQAGAKSYRDVLCGRLITGFNEALCAYYSRHCSVQTLCPPVDGETARRMPSAERCVDLTQNCLHWARTGECDNNPGFMAGECAQSCGACDRTVFPRLPLVGAPDRTCVDDDNEASCRSLAVLGACTTQRAFMEESCRKTCEFCNASKYTFINKTDGAEDTAQHTCPDGSDLGGGAKLIDSEGAEHFAELAAIDDEEDVKAGMPPATARRRAGRGATSPSPAPATGASEQPSPRDSTHSRRRSWFQAPHQHDTTLDVTLLSWPFMLVQSLVLLGAGYLLRGCLDSRRKRKRLPHQLPTTRY